MIVVGAVAMLSSIRMAAGRNSSAPVARPAEAQRRCSGQNHLLTSDATS
jgi:hypothetical protein